MSTTIRVDGNLRGRLLLDDSPSADAPGNEEMNRSNVEETEETSVRGEVEGLRTGPKVGAYVGAEIAVHDPTGHGGPATIAAQKLVCGEEPRTCRPTVQSAERTDAATRRTKHTSSGVGKYKRAFGNR